MNKEKKIPGHILSLFIILLSISGVCLLMYKAQFRFNLHQPIEYVMMTTHKPTGTITLSSDSPVCKLRSNGMPVPLLRNGYSIFNGTKYR